MWGRIAVDVLIGLGVIWVVEILVFLVGWAVFSYQDARPRRSAR
jgi:hypothetical protein